MEKVNYYVCSNDFQNAKRELLNYFVLRKKNRLSSAQPIGESDRNFPLAYTARHFILTGPNENDVYLSSMFLSSCGDYTSMDVLPFIKDKLSFMIMSRQKDGNSALFYSPSSIFPPYMLITDTEGNEIKIYPEKYAYISSASAYAALAEEDIYEINEQSDTPQSPYSDKTGRVYLGFDLSKIDFSHILSARFYAKVTLPTCDMKELLFFNVSDASWTNSLTWSTVKGNVYSYESAPQGPEWIQPEYADSEYLNVTCRFWFAPPMAYQYLSDVEKNSIYGEKLLFLMDAFSKKNEGGYNRVLETGERLSNFTRVLNALIDTPQMTPDYLISILDMMYRDMKSLIENPDLGWSNWAVVRTSGLSKAIDFLPELKEHNEWKDKTRNVMNSLLDKMYSSDFSFRESGLAYSFWCLELFSSAFHHAEINNDPYSAFMRSRLEKLFDASLDALYPNLYDTNIGDSNYNDKTDYLKRLAELFPTKKLKALVSGKCDSSLPASIAYPYSGSVIMRNGFVKDNPFYLALHALAFDGHAHDDLGNVILYAYNRPLLCDLGRYGYSQSDISAHLKSASAHNSVEIEGKKYLSHSQSGAKIEFFASNSEFDFATVSFSPCENIIHRRSVLFVKKKLFALVNDHITSPDSVKLDAHWHFMPHSDAFVDISNHVKTNFSSGANIKIVSPDSDIVSVSDDIFSSGYAMAEPTKKASFSKFGSDVFITTLLLPYNSEEPKVSSASLVENGAPSAAVFDVNSSKCVSYFKNPSNDKFAFYSFDGDMAYISGNTIFIAGGKKFTSDSVTVIESPSVIKDMCVSISGGVVEIESSSLSQCTDRTKAIKIFSPKTTHVLLNGKSIMFTLYSDYVYAVAAN